MCLIIAIIKCMALLPRCRILKHWHDGKPDFDCRRMLRFDEEAHDRRGLRVHLVVRDGRAAALARGDDLEPRLRERGNGPGCAANRHRCRPVQDHEGRRAPPHGQRAVPGQERPRDQIHDTLHPRGTSSRHPRFVFTSTFIALALRSSWTNYCQRRQPLFVSTLCSLVGYPDSYVKLLIDRVD
jgi:plasmid stabilization system protein ParE